VFIINKAKVASRVDCSKRRVVCFRKLLFKSDKKKLSFRRVENLRARKFAVIQEEICCRVILQVSDIR